MAEERYENIGNRNLPLESTSRSLALDRALLRSIIDAKNRSPRAPRVYCCRNLGWSLNESMEAASRSYGTSTSKLSPS